MYLKRLVLKNIRGFTHADLDLCPGGERYPGWTVITGDNGSGKTALLRAIAMATLGQEQTRGLVQDLRGWVTEGADSGSISLEIKPNHEVDRTQRGGYPSKGTFWAEVEIYHEGRDVWNARPTDISRNKKRGAANGPWSQTTTGWFMVGYGPFRRLYGSSPEAQRLMVIPGRIPRFATLFKEDATLAEGEQWMMELQYKKLERQDGQAPALDGLIRLIGSEFLPHGVVIDHVGSEGIWLKDTDRSVLPLSDLSDGYRSALAMLVDIYRHMVDAYGPDIVRTDPSGAVLVDAPGVVLVDEIDAHLHPEW